MSAGRPRVIRNLKFTNNLTLHNEYGIIGESYGVGKPALDAFLSRQEIRRNVLAGGNGELYPADNLFPAVEEFLNEFVDSGRGDYRLRPDSRFRSAASDGTPLGAAVDLLRRRMPPGDFTGNLLRRQ